MLYDLFIPSKTPLDSKFVDAIPSEDVFDPDSLFECARPVSYSSLSTPYLGSNRPRD